MRDFWIGVFTAALFAFSAGAGQTGQAPTKKLIEFGWDEPDTVFMRSHAQQMDQAPFDGCVFHINAVDDQGKPVGFTWECWGKRSFTSDQLKSALEDLKAAPFKQFRSNFLRFNTSPGELDWFDDYTAVVNNARVAAKFARESGCAGILFDTEQYSHKLFSYAGQRDVATKSWEQYAAQARVRGREVMRGFQEGNPDITLLLTFGYTLPFRQSRGDLKQLAKAPYGLLAPFLDGMLDEAKGQARIVDGYESSYGFKDITRFGPAYETMKTGVLPMVADAGQYRKHFSFGFGVWLDNNWRRVGWDAGDLKKNFYSPEAFEKTVRAALDRSDEYVWIYSETPKWWTAGGGAEKLPGEYGAALRRAAGK